MVNEEGIEGESSGVVVEEGSRGRAMQWSMREGAPRIHIEVNQREGVRARDVLTRWLGRGGTAVVEGLLMLF